MVPESPAAPEKKALNHPDPWKFDKRFNRYKDERLPSINRTQRAAAINRRHAASVAEARSYNATITPEDREAFYQAGINSIAQKIWHLASTKGHNANELRIYVELFMKHLELQIKHKKTELMLRQMELYEKRQKLVEEATKDSGLSDAQYRARMRSIFYPLNGHDAPKQIENGFTS